MLIPPLAIISSAAVVMFAQSTPVMVDSQSGLVIFGHTLEFWATGIVAVVSVLSLVTQKARDRRESDRDKALALSIQRAEQAEKLHEATKAELDAYRMETHTRLEKAHADLISFTLENEKLRQMTDMTPFTKQLVALTEATMGVVEALNLPSKR